MGVVLRVVVPAVSGAVVAGLLAFGLVSSQTGAPDSNPADQPVISYGARS